MFQVSDYFRLNGFDARHAKNQTSLQIVDKDMANSIPKYHLYVVKVNGMQSVLIDFCNGLSHWGDALSQWGYALFQWGYALSQWGYDLSQWGYELSQWGSSRSTHICIHVSEDTYLDCIHSVRIKFGLFLRYKFNMDVVCQIG